LDVREEQAIATRLDRIEAMERAGEPADLILAEIALLAGELERWVALLGPDEPGPRRALDLCLNALDREPAALPPLTRPTRPARESEISLVPGRSVEFAVEFE
jgi:hypothetical protein